MYKDRREQLYSKSFTFSNLFNISQAYKRLDFNVCSKIGSGVLRATSVILLSKLQAVSFYSKGKGVLNWAFEPIVTAYLSIANCIFALLAKNRKYRYKNLLTNDWSIYDIPVREVCHA